MNSETEHTELFTAQQAADFLQVSISTLRLWKKANVGPTPVKIGPRCVRYFADQLEDWVWYLRRIQEQQQNARYAAAKEIAEEGKAA